MAGDRPDRERIRRDYWRKAFAIYDHIPMSVDARADQAARKFADTLREEANTAVTL